VKIRLAAAADIERIAAIMRESMAGLGTAFYDETQTRSAVQHIAVVDPQLIDDGTYFAVEDGDEVIACGGWSRRAKLFTGTGSNDARMLDPAVEPARVRAMFVAPSHARRGVGRMILDACEEAARAAGFTKVELMATLPGEPLYAVCGYAVTERVELTLPDGVRLGTAKMEKTL
jgi:GNAT superfamily N-acetyltransferase